MNDLARRATLRAAYRGWRLSPVVGPDLVRCAEELEVEGLIWIDRADPVHPKLVLTRAGTAALGEMEGRKIKTPNVATDHRVNLLDGRVYIRCGWRNCQERALWACSYNVEDVGHPTTSRLNRRAMQYCEPHARRFAAKHDLDLNR